MPTTHANPTPDGQNAMEKLAEVMLAVNNSMTLMAQRLSVLEGSRAAATAPAAGALPAIHHKDVDKPPKYDGKNWTVWSSDFLTFLDRRDKRWSKLLKAIDKRSLNPLTKEIRVGIADELAIDSGTLVEDFTNQLYEYLKNYTSGEVQSCVVSAGREGSWESWRVMCDHGKSRRKIEVHEDYKRLMNPSQVSLENLLKTVAAWERDLLNYTMNNDDKGLPEDTKILCLESMCPEALQEHLLDRFEQGFIETYDEYKQAINTYVYRRTKKKPSKKLCSLYSEPAQCNEDDCDQHERHEEEEDPEFDKQILALKQQAEAINGQINALVNNKFAKPKGKGKGKGDKGGAPRSPGGPSPMQVDHSGKDCYTCGEIGHIAANCPNGGKGKGGFPAGTKGDKSKGKGSKGDKGKGKGNGGKSGWPPSLQNWRQWHPGPSPSQWAGWWRQAQGNNYKGTANLFEQGNRLSQLQQHQQQGWEQNGWQDGGAWPAPSTPNALQALFSGGNMYQLVEKGPKPGRARSTRTAESPNKFQMLQEDDDEEAMNEAEGITTTVPITSLIKPESRNRQRKKTRARPDAATDPLASLSPTCTRTVPVAPPIQRTLIEEKCPLKFVLSASASVNVPGRPRALGSTVVPTTTSTSDSAVPLTKIEPTPIEQTGVRGGMGLPADEAHTAETPDEKGSYWSFNANTNILDFVKQRHRGDVIPRQGLRALRQVQKPEKLAPLTERERPKAPNGWEVLSAVVDSGATITAVHPKDGKAYKVQESAASKAGVTYGTAGGDDLPDLGEKSMAVLTVEGTLRGFRSQVAEVSEPLESVRQLLKSRHCVLFGLGENEDEHLIINKITGEVNRLRDDGINYLHDMLVVPPEQVEAVQQAINNGDSPFGGQGNGR